MSQEKIYNLIKDNPRICTKELIDLSGLNARRVCEALRRMVNKEIRIINPTKKELETLLEKYPTMVHAGKEEKAVNKIKLFEVIE